MENRATALAKSDEKRPAETPIMVEAETMFERFADISREIAGRAFDFFQERGSEFGTQLDDWFRAESELLRPAPVDITENATNINVRLAVPGFKSDEIELSVKDDQLFMSGETRSEEEKEDETTFYSEWKSNRFCRQFTLPSNVDPENVNAELKEGILRVTLRKIAPKEASRIEVKPAQ